MVTTAKFSLGAMQHALPGSARTRYDDALVGGSATFDRFQERYGSMTSLGRILAEQGKGAWKSTLDANGNPQFVVADGQGNSLVATALLDESLLSSGTDGMTKEAGVASVTLKTDEGASLNFWSTVSVVTGALASLEVATIVAQAILPSVTTFVAGFFAKMSAADLTGEDAAAVADSMAEKAAEEAAVEVTADEIAIEVTATAIPGVGALVALGLIAVTAIFILLSKKMTVMVTFVNQTSGDITLDTAYLYDTDVSVEPSASGSVVIPAQGVPPAPPGCSTNESVSYYADYVFLNSDAVKGLGFVLQAHMSGGLVCSALADIPAWGDNSVFVGFGNHGAEGLYDDNEGDNTSLSSCVNYGPYDLWISANRNSGECVSPVDGSTGYFYTYLVLLFEGS